MFRLPTDVLYLIASFHLPQEYTLRSDINSRQLHRGRLMTSIRGFCHTMLQFSHTPFLPSAVWCSTDDEHLLSYLFRRPVSIYLPSLYVNPHDTAVSYMLAHHEPLDWSYVCQNPNERIVDRLLYQFELMYWNTQDVEWFKKWHRSAFNTNDRMVSYFLEHTEYISPFMPFFWKNTNERMLQYLWEHYRSRVHWPILSGNTSDFAVDILLSHLEHVEWVSANENANPRIIAFLIEHPDYIIPISFSKNPSPLALEYLLLNPTLIDWYSISNHPHLFVPDPIRTKKRIEEWTNNILSC